MPRDDVTRRGLRLLGTSIREEPRIFVGAIVGSGLYGAMTVGSAEAVGWATSHVVLPSFRDGRITTGLLVAGAASA